MNRISTRFTFFLAFLVCSPGFRDLHAATHYVSPSGAGTMDGSSWANAAPGTALQTVIDAAQPGDEVWVACGQYMPTTGTDRSLSFHMRVGVAIYGSFQGNESQLSDRVMTCGPCSNLSGEIGNAGAADNSYTVVYNEELDTTAVLDGFHISDGNDDRNPSSAGDGLGGGLYNHGFGSTGFCHPVIRNCVFTDNSASWGGGAFNNGYDGGNTQPTYINCIFAGNHGYIEAGGMDSYGVRNGNASPTLYNCLFYGNTAATNVGAMYAWGGNNGNCEPTLINCAFVNNSAQNGYGGAFIADNLDENAQASSGNCVVTLQNCIVWNNTASGQAPQFYVRGSGAQVQATYSCIDMTGQTGPHIVSGPGTGNTTSNPMFQDISSAIGTDACWMTPDDGIRLSINSPLIDSGSNAGVYPVDLLGLPRVMAFAVDMGPYETQPPVSVGAGPAKGALRLFPNPATERLTLEGRDLGDLQVFDLTGRQLSPAIRRRGAQQAVMEVEGLAPGIYFVRSGGQTIRFRKL